MRNGSGLLNGNFSASEDFFLNLELKTSSSQSPYQARSFMYHSSFLSGAGPRA